MEGYIFDYRLGYVRDGCTLPGFDVFGTDDAPCGRIVAIGGYTTPEPLQSGRSWVELLYRKLEGKYQILSGCTDGYSSAQILTMFIRDAVLFRPKLVICFSGFYDIAYKLGFVENKADAELLKTHSFSTPGQIAFLRRLTPHFGLGNYKVYYGQSNDMPACELWLRRMAEIKCLCDEFEIGFRSALQPCVFSGKYVRSEEESSFLREYYKISDDAVEAFRARFQQEYREITIRAEALDYIVDLSGVFDHHKDVYYDACHAKDEYFALLAEEIL